MLMSLREPGRDVSGLLQDLGLPADVPASPELFVAASTMYELVERCGDMSGDPFFGYHVGRSLELRAWEVLETPLEKARTVGELLVELSLRSDEHSSSTEYYVSSRGDRSAFGFERAFRPAQRPGHNDSFYMGLMENLLQQAAHSHWEVGQVLFQVSDPSCVPGAAQGYRVVKGDRMGVRITFPTAWMLQSFNGIQSAQAETPQVASDVPQTLRESMKTALEPHLRDIDLSVDKAARLCGFERRRLARALRDRGTSISQEVASLKAEKATRQLVDTDLRVVDIGESVGFTDPTVFSRAFKKWTGQSPQQYRRTHKSPQ